jgi:peptidoglycan/LPS O-acetylase OafA/YrhL
MRGKDIHRDLKSRARRLFELQTGASRLLPMEGMRGMSAGIVFFVHFYALFGSRAEGGSLDATFRFLAAAGHCGVDVFFALSAYIIYGLIIGKPIRYGPFLRRRVIRLYPAFGVVLAIYVVLNLAFHLKPMGPGWFGTLSYILANALMLPGIFPISPLMTVAWSLSYEFCFYITIPLALRALRFTLWPRGARVLFVLSACAAQLTLTHAGVTRHPRLVMFGCGILMHEAAGFRFRWLRLGSVLALAAFIAAVSLNGLSGQVVNPYSGPVMKADEVCLASLFVSTLALGHFALSAEGFLASCFRWDWIRWFGNMSYSYYLVHGLALHVVKTGLEFAGLPPKLGAGPLVALWLFSFAVTAAAAATLFGVVEKRFSLRRPSPLPQHPGDASATHSRSLAHTAGRY